MQFLLTPAAIAAADTDIDVARSFAYFVSSLKTDQRTRPIGGWLRHEDKQRWSVTIGDKVLYAVSTRHGPQLGTATKEDPRRAFVCQRCGFTHADQLELVILGISFDDVRLAVRADRQRARTLEEEKLPSA